MSSKRHPKQHCLHLHHQHTYSHSIRRTPVNQALQCALSLPAADVPGTSNPASRQNSIQVHHCRATPACVSGLLSHQDTWCQALSTAGQLAATTDLHTKSSPVCSLAACCRRARHIQASKPVPLRQLLPLHCPSILLAGCCCTAAAACGCCTLTVAEGATSKVILDGEVGLGCSSSIAVQAEGFSILYLCMLSR
jgi:hypothetical protein